MLTAHKYQTGECSGNNPMLTAHRYQTGECWGNKPMLTVHSIRQVSVGVINPC